MSKMLEIWKNGVLEDMLNQPNVNEVMINSPHVVFVETNGVIESYDDKDKVFTQDYLKKGSLLTAAYTHQILNQNNPILSATFPSGERVQVVIPPACDLKQYVISIRKPAAKRYTLDDYYEKGFFDHVNELTHLKEKTEVDDKLDFYEKKQDWRKFMVTAVRGKKTIIVSGSTGTGKTTFTNCLIDYINHLERLITIEDAREVLTEKLTKNRNIVNLLTSQKAQGKEAITFADLIKCCLRLRPDRILLSELRGSEAYDYLNATNTGHSGSITSLHTNSAEDVYDRLVTMIKMSPAGSNLKKEDINDYCKKTIDIIMHCGKNNSHWGLESVIRRS
jgi:type IV secretion system protein VirB11